MQLQCLVESALALNSRRKVVHVDRGDGVLGAHGRRSNLACLAVHLLRLHVPAGEPVRNAEFRARFGHVDTQTVGLPPLLFLRELSFQERDRLLELSVTHSNQRQRLERSIERLRQSLVGTLKDLERGVGLGRRGVVLPGLAEDLRQLKPHASDVWVVGAKQADLVVDQDSDFGGRLSKLALPGQGRRQCAA